VTRGGSSFVGIKMETEVKYLFSIQTN